MMKKWSALLALTALAVMLAACGGGNDNGNGNEASPSATAPASTGSSEPAQEVVITATSWEFDQAEYKIPANTPVKLTLKNDKGAHAIKIADVTLAEGQNSHVFTLEPGTYEFRCTIMCGAGHNKMVSKLVVE